MILDIYFSVVLAPCKATRGAQIKDFTIYISAVTISFKQNIRSIVLKKYNHNLSEKPANIICIHIITIYFRI